VVELAEGGFNDGPVSRLGPRHGSVSPLGITLWSEIHGSENLFQEKAIPYTWHVEQDWTDALLDRWAAVRPRQEMEPYQVTARISRIALHIARHQEEAFDRFGLNRGEVGVLGALRFAGPKQQLSPTRLFKGLMLSSAGITSRLDRLERRGYVKRTRHPDDRRGVLVELTEDGREILDQAVGANTGREKELLANLTTQEQKALAGLLKKLLAGLEPTTSDGAV
jgi:DNA-binding MarR family transcriptional regulator